MLIARIAGRIVKQDGLGADLPFTSKVTPQAVTAPPCVAPTCPQGKTLIMTPNGPRCCTLPTRLY